MENAGLRIEGEDVRDKNGRILITEDQVAQKVMVAHQEILHGGVHQLWQHVSNVILFYSQTSISYEGLSKDQFHNPYYY